MEPTTIQIEDVGIVLCLLTLFVFGCYEIGNRLFSRTLHRQHRRPRYKKQGWKSRIGTLYKTKGGRR